MNLKRWLMPPAAIVFIIALWLLLGLIISLIENVTLYAIITLILSGICITFPIVFSFVYGFRYLKDAKRKFLFILYNASWFAVPLALSVFLIHNAFALILSPFLFVGCVIFGALGHFISKKSEPQTEYAAQFDGVSMNNE